MDSFNVDFKCSCTLNYTKVCIVRAIQCKVLFSSWFAKEANLMTGLLLPRYCPSWLDKNVTALVEIEGENTKMLCVADSGLVDNS